MQSQKMGSVWLFSIILINCSEKEEFWSVWGGENIALAAKKWVPALKITAESKARGRWRNVGALQVQMHLVNLCIFLNTTTLQTYFLPFHPSQKFCGRQLAAMKATLRLEHVVWKCHPQEFTVDLGLNEVNKILPSKKWAEPIIHQELVCLPCKFKILLFWQELLTLRRWTHQVHTHFSHMHG